MVCSKLRLFSTSLGELLNISNVSYLFQPALVIENNCLWNVVHDDDVFDFERAFDDDFLASEAEFD